MIDGDKLQQAMDNVAQRTIAKELRNAIAFGPPILGEVFKEYEKLCEPVKKKYILVIAGTHEQFVRFRSLFADDNSRQLIYVSDLETLRGVSSPMVVYVGTWWERKDIDDIRAIVRTL